jgi:hypothetical protein
MQHEQKLPLLVLGVTGGKTKLERVSIVALRECRLRDPAALISPRSKTGIRRKITRAVAIPPMELAPGDQILLYTGSGRASVENTNGSTVHRVYLSLRKPLWGGLRALRIVDLECLAWGRRLSELSGDPLTPVPPETRGMA